VLDHCKISPILLDNKSELILVFLEILPHNASFISLLDFTLFGLMELAKKDNPCEV
jgi:hypothetical protein